MEKKRNIHGNLFRTLFRKTSLGVDDIAKMGYRELDYEDV